MEFYEGFTVIPIIEDGNCFFRSISYCLFGNQDNHRKMRIDTVDHITENWSKYHNFIVGYERLEYASFMKADRQHADQVEIDAVADLNPDCTFSVHIRNNGTIVNHGVGNEIHHLLYSYDEMFDVGHYDVLKIHSLTRNRRKRKTSLTGRREKSKWKMAKRAALRSNANPDSVTHVTSEPEPSLPKKKTTNRRICKPSLTGSREKNRLRASKRTLRNNNFGNLGSPANTVEPYSVGTLSQVCSHCGALYFEEEKNSAGQFSLCCYNGKIKLHPFTILPEIEALFTGKDESSKNFRENIRQYNSALSFVSFGANVVLPHSHGPYCFKIQGMPHHRISPLSAETEQNSSFGQLYILDFDVAKDIRMSHSANRKLLDNVFDILIPLLDKKNPYVHSYKNMCQKIKEETETALRENRQPIDLEMRFYHEPSADPRRYNNPTTSEVAAIFETSDGAPPSHRCIRVYQKDGGLKNINYDSMHCDPMSYVLIWPCGEPGWHIETPIEGSRITNIRKKVTMREFILYRISIRGNGPAGHFNPIINSAKLTQQILVDYYCRIEGDRLKYIRREQARLRVDSYVGLADALQVRAEQNKVRVGRMVILPSSFSGSPRNMMQNYQDAMALVRKFGKPDLFITFTCNAGWPEIKNSIHSWEVASNRPDIVVRVFHSKAKKLLKELTIGKIFGAVKSFLYTVEFQKRGLPHIHLLLTLADDHKLRDSNAIDKVVSAEIPDLSNEVLYKLVSKHMVHGPCGQLNPSNVCMKDNMCSKKFPKDFVEETKDNVNGYPLYKRPDNGRTIEKTVGGKKIIMDNRDIVPYNPYLLLRFQAHINVEVCSSVKSVKYIHKYVYKGHDCCNLAISRKDQADQTELNHDEIQMFLNARYVSSTEAAYRLFAYPMHEQSHTVVKLPVHLPNAQNVYFDDGKAEEALMKAKLRDTQLIAWFKLNQDPATKSPYIYPETPLHYTWGSSECLWHRRKNSSKAVGRMYVVSPTDTEMFYLRELLLHVIGATNFEDVRTYENVVYPTFKDAAAARGLIADDSEWHRCLEEVSLFQMPSQLRDLFAYICIFQQPKNACTLWDSFKDSLAEDYSRNHPTDIAYQLALRDVAGTLKLHALSLSSFNLPILDESLLTNEIDEFQFILNDDLNNMLSNANEEQIAIINEVLGLLRENNTSISNAYFIDGPGGTGKTYVYRCLIHSCFKENFPVISVAWTGIAAMLLPLGRTAHSRFKFPLNLHENSVSNLKINSKEACIIKKTRLIIWDEAPMANKHALMCLNRLLKDIMNNDVPFGGKVIILGGDFRQVLPVVPHGSRATTVQNSIKFSPLWPLFKIFQLTINMRANDDALEFSNFLLKIGNGEYPYVNVDEMNSLIDLPECIIAESDIVTEIYGNILSQSISDLSKVAILAPKNDHCDTINKKVLNLLPGNEKIYKSVNKLITEDSSECLQFPTEFLDSLEVSALPPHSLHLKEGCIVMLLRNLNAKKGLLNGTRLIVKQMHENSLFLEIINGIHVGERVLLSRIDLTPSDTVFPFSFKRRQFPIRLAFCMTINKAQGQTLDRLGLYLPDPVFSHGQLYVALSRAKCFSHIKVEIKPKGRRTANVVWKEVL